MLYFTIPKISKTHILFFILFLLVIGLFSCNIPTELSVPDGAKDADIFSRTFIDKIISGQPESAFLDVDTKILNDEAREFIATVSLSINGELPEKYRVVEAHYTSIANTTGKITNYRLGYEYEFEGCNILFVIAIKEEAGNMTVLGFSAVFLVAPLAELTKFTLSGKPAFSYIFLILCVLVPLFIVTTFIVMLLTKMTIKKKIIWALLILLLTLPRLIINWDNGQLDFNLTSIHLVSAGFNRPTLYSAWNLSFSIPVGAILFWIKRKGLQSNAISNMKKES